LAQVRNEGQDAAAARRAALRVFSIPGDVFMSVTSSARRGTNRPQPEHLDRRDEIVAAMSRVPATRRRRGRVVAVVILSMIVVVYAAVPYLLLDPSIAQQKVGLRADVPLHFPLLVAHALAGGIALLLGPWQFVRRVRRIPRVHRYLGRAFLFAGVVPASIAGMAVAWLSTAGPAASLGFALLDVAWLGTAFAGYRAARAGRYRDHQDWMIRCFAATFAAVTLRLWLVTLVLAQLPLLHSVYHGHFHALFHTAYVTVAWLAWVPNLLVVEWYLRRGRRRRDRAPAPAETAVPTA
jgi:hypothetical protein